MFFLDLTHDGHDCLDECIQRGFEYFWCHTQSGYGFCTPDSLRRQQQPSTTGTAGKTTQHNTDYFPV